MSCISLIEISLIVNEKLVQLKDNQDAECKKIEIWINSIVNQTITQSRIKKDRCEMCNSKEDSCDLESHHIAGRKHDYRQMTVCKPCHRWLSNRQKMWDVRWLQYNHRENLTLAFFLLGLSDILVLKTKKTGNSIYEKLADSYIEKISELLKRS